MIRHDVVFLHIPKTAGTSVRLALEQSLQDHLILRDYGPEPETTPDLYDILSSGNRLAEFRQRFDQRDRGILLTGHFPQMRTLSFGAARYWEFFSPESFVTFLRHPIDRLYSAFGHFVNQRGWKQGFDEFIA